jgi:lycopene cyclase domain-containing protein
VSGLYLTGLLIGIAGMIVLDMRYALFFRAGPWRATVVMLVGVAFFLVWDSAGVGLHIFLEGAPSLLVGVQLAPEIPLEEFFFVLLLCYLTMNLYGALSRRRSRRSRPVEAGGRTS